MSNPKTTIYLFLNGKSYKPPIQIQLEQIQKQIQERDGKLWYECQNLYDIKGNLIKKIGKIKKNEIFVIVPPECKFVPGKYKEFHNKYIKGIGSDVLDAETYCMRALASPRLKVILQTVTIISSIFKFNFFSLNFNIILKTPRGCQEYNPKSLSAPHDIAIQKCSTPRSGIKSKKRSTSCFNKKKKLPKYPALNTKRKKQVCPKSRNGGNFCPNSGGRKKKRNSGLKCCKSRPATYRKPYIPRNKRKTPRNIVGETPRKVKVAKKNKNWFNCWPFSKKKKVAPRHVYCDLDCKENRNMYVTVNYFFGGLFKKNFFFLN